MRLILNVIWLIFGGLWLALGYLLAALICFVLIITIPFGFAALRIASYALWPFGRTIVEKPGPRPGALVGNVIWIILFGIWLAIGHVITAVVAAYAATMKAQRAGRAASPARTRPILEAPSSALHMRARIVRGPRRPAPPSSTRSSWLSPAWPTTC